MRALELAAGRKINIWTDSKYTFGMVHAHGAIWKEEILKLLEAVKQPEKVAIMHCQGHQKGEHRF